MFKSRKKTNVANYIILSLVILVIYFLSGKLGLSIAFLNKSASPIWPATGIAIVSIIMLGYRLWPAIFAGAFILNMITTPSVLVSLGIALGNTLEGLAGAYLINRFANGNLVFKEPKTTIMFFIVSIIAPVISATIGVSSLAFGGFAPYTEFWNIWATWLVGDIMGAIVIVPLVLGFYRNNPKMEKSLIPELFLAMLLLILTRTVLFLGWPLKIGGNYHLLFLCLPFLLWIAFRFTFKEATIALFITSIISIIGTIFNLSVLNKDQSINSALIFLQIFLATMYGTTLLISVVVNKYKRQIKK